MSISPVDQTRSMAPFLAVAGLCAIGVGLLTVIVMLLSSALEDPRQASATPPNAFRPGPGVTLQPHEPQAEPEVAVVEPEPPALVAVGPPTPAPSPARSVDDLSRATREDHVAFPRGRSHGKDTDRDKDKDDLFDGDVGSRNLASKHGYSGDDDGRYQGRDEGGTGPEHRGGKSTGQDRHHGKGHHGGKGKHGGNGHLGGKSHHGKGHHGRRG